MDEQTLPQTHGHAIRELVALGLSEEASLGILRVLLRRGTQPEWLDGTREA
jgi:hypothetical protein